MSVRMGGVAGLNESKFDAELDVAGVGMGKEDPYATAELYIPPDETEPDYRSLGNPTDPRGMGCANNYVPIRCEDLFAEIEYKAGGIRVDVVRIETSRSRGRLVEKGWEVLDDPRNTNREVYVNGEVVVQTGRVVDNQRHASSLTLPLPWPPF